MNEHDLMEQAAHEFIDRVVAQMEAVQRHDKRIEIAAAEIGLFPFELMQLYEHAKRTRVQS